MKERLMKWNVIQEGKCVSCDAVVESRDHLFFKQSVENELMQIIRSQIVYRAKDKDRDSLLQLCS